MARVINIDGCFAMFSDTFSPKVVGELNGQHVKLVRLEGDKVPWHAHDGEDELFWVLEGVLEVHERDGVVALHPGEFCIVRRGVEHRWCRAGTSGLFSSSRRGSPTPGTSRPRSRRSASTA